MLVSDLSKKIFIFSCFVLVLSLIYLPQISNGYVYHDDYYLWTWDKKSCWDYPLSAFPLILGRPIPAIFLCLSGKQIEYVKDVALFRFLSLILIGIVSTILYNWLKLFNVKLVMRWLFCLAIITLPSFQFYAGGFAVTAPYMPFGIMLSVGAAMILWQPVFEPERFKITNNKFKIILALLMLTISFLSYQANAFYFMSLVSVPILQKKISKISELKRFIIYYYSVFASALIIHTGIFKLFLYFTLKGKETNQIPYIGGVVKDIFGKLKWFFSEPFVNALNLWNLWPSTKVTILVLLVITSGIFLEIIEESSEFSKDNKPKAIIINSGIKYGLILSLIPITSLLNLIVETNFPVYRTTGSLSTLLLILFIFSLQRSLYWIFGNVFKLYPFRQKLALITTVFVVSLGVLTASYNSRYLFAENSVKELNYIELEISRHISEYGKESLYHIHVIRPITSIFYNYRYDEIGSSTTSFWQDIPGIIRCAMKELRIDTKYINKIKITSSSPNTNTQVVDDQKIPKDPIALIIDMNNPLAARLMKEDDINQLLNLETMRLNHQRLNTDNTDNTDVFPRLFQSNYLGFNIVIYKNEFYALAMSLGSIDLMTVPPSTLKDCQQKRQCFVANSLKDLRQVINKHSE